MKFYKIKVIMKKNSFANQLNGFLKSVVLKQELKGISKKYKIAAHEKSLQINETVSAELFQKQHKVIRKDFKTKAHGELNIFWVGANYDQDSTGLLQALKKIGPVICFENNPHNRYGPLTTVEGMNWKKIRELNDEALLQQVKHANEKNRIDVLIGQMWSVYFSSAGLRKIRELGIPVINISMDDRLPMHWKKRNGEKMGSVGLQGGIDFVFTTCPETVLWYAVEKVPAMFWPLASDPDIFAEAETVQKNIDVLFIGNRYGVRESIIRKLTARGINITCFGSGWPNGKVNALQNAYYSKRAKIILGVGTVGHTNDIYTLKLRDFDALMTGALYITHRNPDLLQFFKEGVHLECYENNEELYQKIKYYLNTESARTAIGSQGQREVIERHTWNERFAASLEQLGLIYR